MDKKWIIVHLLDGYQFANREFADKDEAQEWLNDWVGEMVANDDEDEDSSSLLEQCAVVELGYSYQQMRAEWNRDYDSMRFAEQRASFYT